MKISKKKRILSIFTAIAVMFTMSSVSIFALDGAGEPSDNQQQVQTQEDDQNVEEQGEITTTPSIDLTATPKDGKVDLEWTLEGFAPAPAEYTICYGLDGDTSAQTHVENVDTPLVDGIYKDSIESLDNWKEYSFKISVAYNDQTIESETVEAIPSGKLLIESTLSGFNSITVTWTADEGVSIPENATVTGEDFVLTRNGAPVTSLEAAVKDGNKFVFRDTGAYQKIVNNSVSTGDFKYTVKVKGNEDSLSAVVTDQPIQQAYYLITVKMKKSLKSHNYGNRARITLYKGTTVRAVGYGSGKYQFYDNNGNLFYITRISTKNAKACYSPTRYNSNWYTKDEAENFINQTYSGWKSSRTGRLIWVSTFKQHAYIFKAENGAWVLDKDWKISTGKPSAPSPTGVKAVGKKIKYRHGIRYWSCYSSLNALHGVKRNWGSMLGEMKSSGCIRNANNSSTGAEWIYRNCGKGTRVLVY